MDPEELNREEAARETVPEPPDITMDRAGSPAGVRVVRSRFGGIDPAADFGGMLAGLGFLVILAGLLGAAIGGFGYTTADLQGAGTGASIGGMIAGLVALFAAFLVGGWVSGRIARYDGLLNGFITAVLTLIVAALFGLLGVWLGDKYNFFANVGLPTWFSTNGGSTQAIIAGVIAFIVVAAGAMLGGWLGEGYHRRADYTLAEAQEGAVNRSRRPGLLGDRFARREAVTRSRGHEPDCRELGTC